MKDASERIAVAQLLYPDLTGHTVSSDGGVQAVNDKGQTVVVQPVTIDAHLAATAATTDPKKKGT